jgi:uncharacterized SAM-binding protein YcdF (DUF218 family)
VLRFAAVIEQAGISVFVKLEYWEAYRAAVALTVRQFRVVLVILTVVGILALAASVLSLVHPRPNQEWSEIAMNLKPLFLLVGGVLFFVFVVPLITAKKLVNNERIKAGISYRFSPDGIHIESSVATSDLQWAAFRQVRESRSGFLLMQSTAMANIVPRRCFASHADVVAMRDLLRRSVPKTRLLDS